MYPVEFKRILDEPDKFTREVLCRKAYASFRSYRGTTGLGVRYRDAEYFVRNLARSFKGLRFVFEPKDPTDVHSPTTVSLKDYSSFALSREWELAVVKDLRVLASDLLPRRCASASFPSRSR
jgi:hypothetical protein